MDIAGKKPWEVNHLYTMELWRFGDYKQYISIKLLAALFDIHTPQDDIDGARLLVFIIMKKTWEELKYIAKKMP